MMAEKCFEEISEAVAAEGLLPRMALAGVGGAGCRLATLTYNRQLEGMDVVAVNSDARALEATEADVKLLLGSDIFSVDAERQIAMDQRDRLITLFNHDIVIVVLGLGGHAGSGIAPVLADAARANGALVVTLALLPFVTEGRGEAAREALEDLRRSSDLLLTLDNNAIVSKASRLEFTKTLALVNSIALQVVESLHRRLLGTPPQGFLSGVVSPCLDLRGDFSSFPLGVEGLSPPGDDPAPVAMGDGGLIL